MIRSVRRTFVSSDVLLQSAGKTGTETISTMQQGIKSMSNPIIASLLSISDKLTRATSAAIVLGCSTFGALAQQSTLVGTWQSNVGRFTFAVDGRAWGQQLSGGVIYTSFGSYSLQGDQLSVHFDSVRPAYQCSNAGCLPAMPIRPVSFRVRFQGSNILIWGFETPAPVYLQRIG